MKFFLSEVSIRGDYLYVFLDPILKIKNSQEKLEIRQTSRVFSIASGASYLHTVEIRQISNSKKSEFLWIKGPRMPQ